MADRACAVCDEPVRVAGGIGDLFGGGGPSGGMTVELADGSEFFLCFDCLDRLPDAGEGEVSAADVRALRDGEAGGADEG